MLKVHRVGDAVQGIQGIQGTGGQAPRVLEVAVAAGRGAPTDQQPQPLVLDVVEVDDYAVVLARLRLDIVEVEEDAVVLARLGLDRRILPADVLSSWVPPVGHLSSCVLGRLSSWVVASGLQQKYN